MIYIHVPFCRSFCTYCDFYSEVAARCRKAEDALRQETLFGRFSSALAAEIRNRKKEIQGACATSGVNTLYIGGGTPSVLPLSVFERLLSALSDAGCGGPFDEVTVEVNPEDIVENGPAYVEKLLGMGVNRVSMGVQSFDDNILRWMNRRHDSATAVKAYRILEDAGVQNISIDLIFGLPQLTDVAWKETLDRALSISSRGVLPYHISSYQLSVEPDSMLARLVEKGKWTEASDELCQGQYQVLCDKLSDAGYHHYEISNFAIPGHEAVHNSAYWRYVPYIGLGPGAHSFVEKTSQCGARVATSMGLSSKKENVSYVRSWNEQDLQKYIEAAENEEFSDVTDSEVLNDEQIILEKIMLGLRTSEGMTEEMLRASCDAGALDRALARGDIERRKDGKIRIPESRFFVSDAIILNLSQD